VDLESGETTLRDERLMRLCLDVQVGKMEGHRLFTKTLSCASRPAALSQQPGAGRRWWALLVAEADPPPAASFWPDIAQPAYQKPCGCIARWPAGELRFAPRPIEGGPLGGREALLLGLRLETGRQRGSAPRTKQRSWGHATGVEEFSGLQAVVGNAPPVRPMARHRDG